MSGISADSLVMVIIILRHTEANGMPSCPVLARREAGGYDGRAPDRQSKERAPSMKAACTLSRMRDGTWLVRHSSPMLGTVEVSAASREEALTEMRDELQFVSHLCQGFLA